jgi:hypothetical protein
MNYWKQLSHVMKYFRAEEEPKARLPQNFITGFLEVCLLSAAVDSGTMLTHTRDVTERLRSDRRPCVHSKKHTRPSGSRIAPCAYFMQCPLFLPSNAVGQIMKPVSLRGIVCSRLGIYQ